MGTQTVLQNSNIHWLYMKPYRKRKKKLPISNWFNHQISCTINSTHTHPAASCIFENTCALRENPQMHTAAFFSSMIQPEETMRERQCYDSTYIESFEDEEGKTGLKCLMHKCGQTQPSNERCQRSGRMAYWHVWEIS